MREIDNYLIHYGVKGMKWGVRKAIEDDGSLSRVGKERSYTDDESYEMYKNAKIRKEVIADARQYLSKQRDSAIGDYDKYVECMQRDMKSLNNNEQLKSQLKSKLDKRLKDIDLDDEFAEYDVEDAIAELAPSLIRQNHLSKDTQQYEDSFSQKSDVYCENLDNIVNDIVGRHGDEKVNTTIFYSNIYKDVVYNSLQGLDDSRNYFAVEEMIRQSKYRESDNSIYNFAEYYVFCNSVKDEWMNKKR